jgi:WD40 repeat protein
VSEQRVRLAMTPNDGLVYAVAVPASGQQFAMSAGQSVQLVNATSGGVTAELNRHPDRVQALAYSPDGTTLASTGDDKVIAIWDVASGNLRGVLRGHTDRVWCLAFSGDGRTLASAASDGTVRLWDPREFSNTRLFQISHLGVSRLRFVPGTHTAWVSYSDGVIRQWDFGTGRALGELPSPAAAALDYQITADGKLLVTNGGYGIRVWDVPHQWVRYERPGRMEPPFALSPDGRVVAAANGSGGVDLFLAQTGTTLTRLVLPLGAAGMNALTYSRDGSRLFVAGGNGWIGAWEIGTGRFHDWGRVHQDAFVQIALSPDGRVLASLSQDDTIRLTDVDTQEHSTIHLTEHNQFHHLVWAPDGRTLAGATGHRIVLWHACTRRELCSLPWPAGLLTSLDFSPDGRMLAAGGHTRGRDGMIYLWEANSAGGPAPWSQR